MSVLSVWSFSFSNKVRSELVINAWRSDIAYQIEELDERNAML